MQHALQYPLAAAVHEQQRLIQRVYPTITDWRRKQPLPDFTLSLGDADLDQLFASAEPNTRVAARLLLQTHETTLDGMTTFLLDALPAALGLASPSKEWQQADVSAALTNLRAACQLVAQLPARLNSHMYAEIGAVFGLDPAHNSTSDTLERALNQWRTQYVLLPDEQLSPNARTVFEMLHRINGDLAGMILTALPKHLREIRAPYGQWTTWETRQMYLATLREAVAEIVAKGTVKDATVRAQQLWHEFQAGITTLSADERRWLIKKVQDELRA